VSGVVVKDRKKALLLLAGSRYDLAPGPKAGQAFRHGKAAPTRKDVCLLCDGERVVRDKFGRESTCESCQGRGWHKVDPMLNRQAREEWWEKPGRMEDLERQFKPDGLLRLARSSQDYYDSHGHYLPGVAVLALHYAAALAEAERERDRQQSRAEIAEIALEDVRAEEVIARLAAASPEGKVWGPERMRHDPELGWNRRTGRYDRR
jgi:hypothetical protein